ncbi:MAG TPA: glycosyltransferase [Mycobacteriales bacterium]|nr:glycosyltransferase [Mycobacteriales bacterium]
MTTDLPSPLRIVVLGLSITSSWGNGHATNYRALVRALTSRGHDVVFAERDVPWYAAHRDLPSPPYGWTVLYSSQPELQEELDGEITGADLVVVGSYVPDGRDIGRWVTSTATGVTAFYDIDTPVTLAALERGDCDYLDADLVPAYDVYLSFTGGPTLDRLEQQLGARRAQAFHCLVDPDTYPPVTAPLRWDLGYLGTYSEDRQPAVERLLLEPARARPDLRFVVAGPQYPAAIDWPANVERIEHLPPDEHPAFYAAQRFTLNVTRAEMVRAGWSPSVRLFEAAACGVPVVSDRWEGLDSFFRPGEEIVIADAAADVLAALDDPRGLRRQTIGRAARARVLAEHTAEHRAGELEELVRQLHRVEESA